MTKKNFDRICGVCDWMSEEDREVMQDYLDLTEEEVESMSDQELSDYLTVWFM